MVRESVKKRKIKKQNNKRKTVKGKGLINWAINNIPFEMHVPGYQYCGPGTKLAKRLQNGDPGINPLDAACKEHDIAYSQNKNNLTDRHKADEVLAEKALKRVFAKDAKIDEKVIAWSVANAMKAKSKLGMGQSFSQNKNKKAKAKCKTLKKTIKKKKKLVSLKKLISMSKKVVNDAKPTDSKTAIKCALNTVNGLVKDVGGKHNIKKPKVISIPKTGGFLPMLVPIFAGLSALGALAGGAAGVAKAVNDASAAKKQLEENQRHNKAMEAVKVGGHGLYMQPYKKGYGLFLSPSNNKLKFSKN